MVYYIVYDTVFIIAYTIVYCIICTVHMYANTILIHTHYTTIYHIYIHTIGAAIRLLQRLQELQQHLHSHTTQKLTHHALLSFWFPNLGEYYRDCRYSSNKAHITDSDMSLVPTETAEDFSPLPLDRDDPTDRRIQQEMQTSKSLTGTTMCLIYTILYRVLLCTIL